jgi:cytoskeletal protein RodZ
MSLSELGAFLRRHREELGLSIEEVEAQTKIRRKYLEAMEAGDWDSLPPGVYTRGLLRNTARALGVSPASVLRMYSKERPADARLPEPQLISQPLIDEPRVNLELVVASLIFLVALALFGALIWSQAGTLLTAAGGAVAGAGPSPTAARGPTQAAATLTPRPRYTAAPLGTATPTPTATSSARLVLVIEAPNRDVWLRVSTDGQKSFESFLRHGEARRWEANETVRVRTGTAGDTQITINDQRLGPLGASGDVKEVEWRLMPDGNIQQLDQSS